MREQPEQLIKEITVQQLKTLFDNRANIQLIDVREQYERDVVHIGGILIPVGKLYFNLAEIARDKQVVIYCRSGRRSGEAVKLLQEAIGLQSLYNLKGGILAWAAEIDKTIAIKL